MNESKQNQTITSTQTFTFLFRFVSFRFVYTVIRSAVERTITLQQPACRSTDRPIMASEARRDTADRESLHVIVRAALERATGESFDPASRGIEMFSRESAPTRSRKCLGEHANTRGSAAWWVFDFRSRPPETDARESAQDDTRDTRDTRIMDDDLTTWLHAYIVTFCSMRWMPSRAPPDSMHAYPALLLLDPPAPILEIASRCLYRMYNGRIGDSVPLSELQTVAFAFAPWPIQASSSPSPPPQHPQPVTMLHRCVDVMRSTTLVLDLNGLLIDKIFDPTRHVRSWMVHAQFDHFRVLIRPGALHFLHWALQHYSRVGVWSSLRRANAAGIIAAAFPRDVVDRLAFIWGNEQAPRDDLHPEIKDGGRNCAILKDLDVLASELRVPADTMVIVDDSELKVRTHRHRAVVIPPSVAFHPPDFLHGSIFSDREALSRVVKPALVHLALCDAGRLR